MAYTILRQELGLHRKFTGNFGLDDIMLANLEAIEDTNTDAIQYVIDDLTAITSATLSDDDLPSIVNLNKILSHAVGELKIAIIIDHDPLQIALAEKFCEQMKSSPFEASVFNTVSEARKWIATAS